MKTVILSLLLLVFTSCSNDSNTEEAANKNPQTGSSKLTIQADSESDPSAVYDFGTLLTRTTKNVVFTLTNNSVQTAELIGIQFSNPVFKQVSGQCAEMQGVSKCDLTFAFSPEQAGSYASDITIEYKISGVKDFLKKNVIGISKNRAIVKFSDVKLDFGVADLPASVVRSVLIENTGDTTAEDLSFSTLSSPFSLASSTCAKSLAASNSCVLNIQLTNNTVSTNSLDWTLSYSDGASNASTSLRVLASTTNGSFNQAKGFDDDIYAVETTQTGEMYVGGEFSTFSDHLASHLNKFGVDFQPVTFTLNSGFDAEVRAIKSLPNGKLYVGGDFTSYNGSAAPHLIRLNSDGTLDSSFNEALGLDGTVLAIEVDSNNKVLVAGQFSSLFARLNEDGSVDNTLFLGTGFVGNSINAIGIDSNNRIILSGNFSSYKGDVTQNLVRMDSTGARDTSFDTTTATNGTVLAMIIDSSDGLYLGGEFTSYKGVTANRIIRLTSNGNKEPMFNYGSGFNAIVKTLAPLDADANEVYVGGDFTRYQGTTVNRLVKLNSQGSVDSSFAVGSGFSDSVLKIKKISDGSILVGGSFKNYGTKGVNHLVRISDTGTLVPTFLESTGASKKVNTLLPLPDGSVILAGSFSRYADQNSEKIVKVDRHGNIDSSFSVGTGFDAQVNAAILSPFQSNKYIFAGQFLHYNAQSVGKIIQLNADGTKNSDFNSGSGFNGSVNALASSNGALLCGGQFTSYNGTTVSGLVKLDSTGSLNPSFSTGGGFNGTVWALAVTADGKIYAAGDFTTYNGVTTQNLVRLLSDGTLDTTFNIGSGFDLPVWSIALDANESVFAGGDFTSFNGNSVSAIAKLNTDGSMDSAFQSASGFDGSVNSIFVNEDFSIFVTGSFTQYQGVAQGRLAKINSTGSLDNSFVTGTGLNSSGATLKLASDGSLDIYIGGEFSSYNGKTTDSILRLSKNGTIE